MDFEGLIQLMSANSIFSLLKDLTQQDTGLRYIETLLRYLFNTVDITVDQIKSIVEQSLSNVQGELIMTLAEKLRNEGFLKGIEKGKQQGMQPRHAARYQRRSSRRNRAGDHAEIWYFNYYNQSLFPELRTARCK